MQLGGGILQDGVYKNQISDMEELRQCIDEKWDSFDERVIDTAVSDWRERLKVCCTQQDISNMHFEHNMHIC